MRRVSLVRHTIWGLAALALLWGGVGQAQAGFVQLFSPADLNPGDTTAIYTGADGELVSSPYNLAAGGNTLTFTATTGTEFLRADQGMTWTPGAFPDTTKLLWTFDPVANSYSPVSIGFASTVTEVGLQVQQDDPVSTKFTATVFSGTTPELTITVTVPDSGGAGNLGFIGFRATGSDTITSILISSIDSTDTTFNNDFAMGPVTFPGLANAVPEPSTLVMAGISTLGLLLVCGRRRRKLKAA
jgi:hypothetical protein